MAESKLKYLPRDTFRIINRPLAWQLAGLQQTASGYGKKLTSSRMVWIDGEKRPRRIYVMQWSNAGTAYVLIKGEMWIVNEHDARSVE